MLTQLQQRFRHEAHQGRPVALLIDEAQDLPLETLEQLPLLVPLTSSQEPLLQIGLVGQPALLQHLRRRRRRRVAQRIGRHATIRPLTEAESLAYIRQRVARVALPGGPIFTPGALQTIVRHAHGVPHDVNLLCTNALLAGYWAHQQPITADLVQQVLAVTRGAQRFPLGRLGLATAAGLGLVAGLLWVASFSAGPQPTHRSPATRAHPQREAPRPTSAPVLGVPPLQQPEPAAPAASPPSTAVGHDPGEDPVRHGPPEALERPGLETPSATLTPLGARRPTSCRHPAPTRRSTPVRLPEGESPQSVPRAAGRDSGEARREKRHGLSVDDPRERRRARTPDRGELRGWHQKDCPPSLAGRAVTWPEGVSQLGISWEIGLSNAAPWMMRTITWLFSRIGKTSTALQYPLRVQHHPCGPRLRAAFTARRLPQLPGQRAGQRAQRRHAPKPVRPHPGVEHPATRVSPAVAAPMPTVP